MEIVIDIDDKIYNRIKYLEPKANTMLDELMRSIQNGTPLPGGHGRLKDIDAFINKVEADRQHAAYARSWTADDVLAALNNTYAQTVVEAEFPLTDAQRSFLSKVQNDMSRIYKLSETKQKYGEKAGE